MLRQHGFLCIPRLLWLLHCWIDSGLAQSGRYLGHAAPNPDDSHKNCRTAAVLGNLTHRGLDNTTSSRTPQSEEGNARDSTSTNAA